MGRVCFRLPGYLTHWELTKMADIMQTTCLHVQDIFLHLPWDKWPPFRWHRFQQMHLAEWKVCILIRISLKFVSNGPIDNKSALVQIMALHRSGNKPITWTKANTVEFVDAYMRHCREMSWMDVLNFKWNDSDVFLPVKLISQSGFKWWLGTNPKLPYPLDLCWIISDGKYINVSGSQAT